MRRQSFNSNNERQTGRDNPDGPLKPCDEPILTALLRYDCLSSRQLCRLLYSRGSLTYVQAKLKNLLNSRFIERAWLPKTTPRGSSPALYSLGARGLKHLQSMGLATRKRHRPSEIHNRSYLFLNHTLELNDFLISAEILDRVRPSFRVAHMVHERQLRAHPVYVESENGEMAPVIPDAWVDLRLNRKVQVCLVIELDRGTEGRAAWSQKVARLLAYASGPYQESFNTRSLTITIATTVGERRLLELLRWTEQQLDASREGSQADLFLFASLNPATSGPGDIFFAPRWYRPFERRPLALLAPSG